MAVRVLLSGDRAAEQKVDELHRVLAAKLGGDAARAHKLIADAGGGRDACAIARAFSASPALPRAAYDVAAFVARVHNCPHYKRDSGGEL